MKKILIVVTISLSVSVMSQSGFAAFLQQNEKQEVHKGAMGFPEFAGPAIKGAPKLQPPMLVHGATRPVLTEKHGLAAPALWDWNNDGKLDLLIGEFETCTESSDFPGGEEKGSAIRVYLNQGTPTRPSFTDEFVYAKDTQGNVIEVPQW